MLSVRMKLMVLCDICPRRPSLPREVIRRSCVSRPHGRLTPGILSGRSHWLRRLTEAALRFNARPVAEQKYHYPRTSRCPESNNLSFAVVSYRSLPILRGDLGVPAVWLLGPINVPDNLYIQLSKFNEEGLRNSSFEEPLHLVTISEGCFGRYAICKFFPSENPPHYVRN